MQKNVDLIHSIIGSVNYIGDTGRCLGLTSTQKKFHFQKVVFIDKFSIGNYFIPENFSGKWLEIKKFYILFFLFEIKAKMILSSWF